ncbi:MAG: peptidylprolyl isomerase [Bacilli bacterium]
MKKLLILIFVISVLSGCNQNEKNESVDIKYEDNNEVTYKIESDKENPVALITLSDGEEIALELYPEYAPNTVTNFIYLANEKNYYDGLIFHRVIEDFMVQGGCPYGTGVGNPGYSILGEFTSNGFSQNNLLNKKGTIAMARSQEPDSAGGQFFINVEDNDYLDGEYAVFGIVVSGYDVVLDISKTKTNENDRPLKEVKISKIRVDTKGVEYGEPEVIK